MKLNRVERLLMNNPVRAAMQRRFDAAILERLGGRLEGQRVLEIGCGRGIGIEILLDRLRAAEVHAFDLDPEMAALARHRVRSGTRPARVAVADAVAIPMRSGEFDAVVDFGAIHHVPDWRAALAEIARVLRPGGRFYSMEVTKQSLDRWIVRTLTDHPRADRFDRRGFEAELERNGMPLEGPVEERWSGDLIFGVGRVSAANTAGPL